MWKHKYSKCSRQHCHVNVFNLNLNRPRYTKRSKFCFVKRISNHPLVSYLFLPQFFQIPYFSQNTLFSIRNLFCVECFLSFHLQSICHCFKNICHCLWNEAAGLHYIHSLRTWGSEEGRLLQLVSTSCFVSQIVLSSSFGRKIIMMRLFIFCVGRRRKLDADMSNLSRSKITFQSFMAMNKSNFAKCYIYHAFNIILPKPCEFIEKIFNKKLIQQLFQHYIKPIQFW